MKVFISGSKVGNDQSLPESVGLCLKKIMSDGNEILIGDCWGIDTLVQEYLSAAKYERVTVYSSGSHKKIRSNLGHWIEKWFSSNGRTGYTRRIEKDFHMAEDCDSGVAIWDGESKGTFINMLCLCALAKPCRLFFLKEDRWVDVDSLDDIRDLIGTDGKIDDSDILETLKACGFSDEMRNYIVKEGILSSFELVDVISRAPISIDEKSALFSRLGYMRNLKYEAFASVEENMRQGIDFKGIKHNIRALADLRGERSIWTLFNCWRFV